MAGDYAGKSYKKKEASGVDKWDGKVVEQQRKLTSSNRSAMVSLSGPMKRAEGATLRKW